MRNLLIAASLVAVMMAGCLDETEPAPADVQAEETLAAPGSVRIEARDCVQGGGNSVYSMVAGQTKIGPFYAADQRAEVGDPMIGAYGQPVTGPANGIWHVATVCKSYTYNGVEGGEFGMGWIAQMIERPDFDEWGEPRIQFIVADLSFSDTDVVHDMREAALGAEISPALETLVEWPVPDALMHVIITEAAHGTFDFTAEMHKEFAQKQDEHIRFWMLPRSDGMGHSHEHEDVADEVKYRPISIDIYDTMRDGPTPRIAGESAGTFTHINGEEEQHVGNPLGHYQSGFDRVIEIGPIPTGIEYEVTWLH